MQPTVRLDKYLNRWTSFGLSDIDQRCRRLRQARLIPINPPGPKSPAVDAAAAASIVISLTAEKAVNAADAVIEYAPMQPRAGEYDGAFGCRSFGEAVERILANPKLAEDVAELRICRTYQAAEIEMKNGSVYEYEGQLPKTLPAVHSELVIDGVLMAYLAHDIKQPVAPMKWR